MSERQNITDLAAKLCAGDRAALARAITLVESTREEDRNLAAALLAAVGESVSTADRSAQSIRVGVSGTPGAGKSTLIETLGKQLLEAGERVAVLAIDPSSPVTGGSILGDKTRMTALSTEPRAFVRPSPSGLVLGGVARRTREAIALCEAAGFGVILVETVGIGQSETAVADLVDALLLVTIAGGGDDLQGIKKGILEVVDAVAINKCDGDGELRAREAAAELALMLQLTRGSDAVDVLAVSAATGHGVAALWQALNDRIAKARADGGLGRRRGKQAKLWLERCAEERLLQRFRSTQWISALRTQLEVEVNAGRLDPSVAAEQLLNAVHLAEKR